MKPAMKKHVSTILLVTGAVGLVVMMFISSNLRDEEEETASTQPAEAQVEQENTVTNTDTQNQDTQGNQNSAEGNNEEQPATTQMVETQPDANQEPVLDANAKSAFEKTFGGLKAEPISIEAFEAGQGVILGQPGVEKEEEWPLYIELTAWGGSLNWARLNHFKQIEWKKQESGGYQREERHFPVQGVVRIPLSQTLNDVTQKDPELAQRQISEQTMRLYPFSPLYIQYGPAGQNEIHQIFNLNNVQWAYDAGVSSETKAVYRVYLLNASNERVLELVRTFEIYKGRYDLKVNTRLVNLATIPLSISFRQLGQASVQADYNAYMGSMQSLSVGYYNNSSDPEHINIYIKDFKRIHLNEVMSSQDFGNVWPNEKSSQKQLEYVWMSLSSRYFAAMTFDVESLTEGEKPAYDKAPPLGNTYAKVLRYPRNTLTDNNLSQEQRRQYQIGAALAYENWMMDLQPGEPRDYGLGAYLGPKSDKVLTQQPYQEMSLGQVVIHEISTCMIYSYLAFGFISQFLLMLMSWIHTVTHDWSLAIIVLVIIVRAALHPILRKSQMNMMRFGKRMQELAPEVEKLKKKYGEDQQKMNQEMMRLYREKKINPIMGGLGCLPMFLQMPIWIGLYNMLATAIQLRQQPAFYGLFQNFGGWTFMDDLARQDAFIPLQPFLGPEGFIIPFVGWNLTSINLLPILMGVVFYLNQKISMAHSPAPQTDQAKQQQMMMRFMMMLFPLFLYNAPSGLCLYIMTSSLVGILESYQIRKSLKKQEERDEAAKQEPVEPAAKKVPSVSKKKPEA